MCDFARPRHGYIGIFSNALRLYEQVTKMSVRQADTPTTDDELKQAAIDGATKRILRQQPINLMDAIAPKNLSTV